MPNVVPASRLDWASMERVYWQTSPGARNVPIMNFQTDSVSAVAERVRAGQQSAREVVEHCLERIETLNPTINAFVAVDAEAALSQADEIDRKVRDDGEPGPLAGVPIGIKDLEPARGFVTSFGSLLHVNDSPADADSVLVRRLRDAGAVIIGKTNTPEYGHKGMTDNPVFGATTNPWNTGYSPGGSSGGTAAAIAAGMIPLGTGSDGGGSIRIPASLCGLTGLKTETGRIPIAGRSLPGSGLLSCNGPMGRTAEDTAIALDAVCGPDGRDPMSHLVPVDSFVESVAAAAPPSRVIWSATMGLGDVDSEVMASCRAAVDALEAAGTEVIEVDDIWGDDPIGMWLVLWTVSRFKAQGHLIDTDDWEKLTETIRPQIMAGATKSGVDYARAQDAAYDFNWRLEDVLETAPYILCPTNAGQVPELGQDGMINGDQTVSWVKFTMAINMTRNPAGTVCAGLSTLGLPIGLQVIGRHHDDPGVLALMAVLESVIGFEQVAPTT